jgi:uncharacterized protein (TIGR02246 family)
VKLDAPVGDVWALIGDLPRFPEYSAGLERVDAIVGADGAYEGFVCHFKPTSQGEAGIVDRNEVRWYEPRRGYASSGEPNNAFGLRDDLFLVAVDQCPGGTLVTWDDYFDAQDVAAMRASLDDALVDIGERLIARFGGQLIERYARSERAVSGPERAVADLVNALQRGDLDGAAALYEPEAVMVARPGEIAREREQIREALRGFVALRPTLTTAASHVVESGDVALYLGRWTLTGAGPDGVPVTMGGESADVLRRQPDGRWLISIDNPWGTSVLGADRA